MDFISRLFTISSKAPINARSWPKRTDPARCVDSVYVGMRACFSDPGWNVMDRDVPVEDHNDDNNKQSESKVIRKGSPIIYPTPFRTEISLPGRGPALR